MSISPKLWPKAPNFTPQTAGNDCYVDDPIWNSQTGTSGVARIPHDVRLLGVSLEFQSLAPPANKVKRVSRNWLQTMQSLTTG
jgi:hypothetical protein